MLRPGFHPEAELPQAENAEHQTHGAAERGRDHVPVHQNLNQQKAEKGEAGPNYMIAEAQPADLEAAAEQDGLGVGDGRRQDQRLDPAVDQKQGQQRQRSKEESQTRIPPGGSAAAGTGGGAQKHRRQSGKIHGSIALDPCGEGKIETQARRGEGKDHKAHKASPPSSALPISRQGSVSESLRRSRKAS